MNSVSTSNVSVHTLRGLLALVLLVMITGNAWAAIPGVTGTNFNLTAKSASIATPDGDSLMVWGYAHNGGLMQYPGPTMIVNQGDTVTINLSNDLPHKINWHKIRI